MNNDAEKTLVKYTNRMNQPLSNHVKRLRSALLSLSATGENGFEGLIGVTLGEISGVPFRLASSGSQFGIDGKAAYERDAICFEGKRYDGKVPRTEVISKIGELSLKGYVTDIWVLGATSSISTQIAEDARELGAKDGIVILILDWSKTDIPPFAVALAMGGERVMDFLENNIADDKVFRDALIALDEVKKSKDFKAQADRIRDLCNEPSVGLSLAQRANADWLIDAFTNRKSAKIKLRQPLSPGDMNTVSVRQRKALNDKLDTSLNTASAEKKVVFILGDEGCGKSWIVAQNWLAKKNKPLMIFTSAEDFSDDYLHNNVIDFLITKIIKQTDDMVTEANHMRWRRKIERWRSYKAEDPRIIVIIDGINQRPQYDWARIIDSFGDELNQLGGRLIVTARMLYFQGHVKNRLSVSFNEIQVPEWKESERDVILAEHDIKASDLHCSVAKSLCNPRLLGIALELFDKADVISFEEISASRLLFEHIRISERDSSSPQPAFEFAKKLQKHAQDILSRVEMKQRDDLNIFESDMDSVADGRFFQAVDGDPTRYSLKDDGFTLALGFSVVDRLRIVKRNNRNLDAELDVILDPIAALDDTADVVIAALTVTVTENRDEHDIVISLVKGFVELQNPDEDKFPSITGLLKALPEAFMEAARILSLEGGHQLNYDWVRGALIIAGRNSSVWQRMASNVHAWLSVYSLSPEPGTFSRPTRDSQQQQEERDNNRKKIEDKLKGLSENERAIFENLLEVNGNFGKLSELALLLLAGKYLAPFANGFLNWSFSNALNSDRSAPYKYFIDLVKLNLVDWSQTRMALLELSTELREADVSTTGKWTLVNILRATGRSDDAVEARALVEELTKDQERFEGWRLIENYCETDPCNPTSEQPKNLIKTSEQYAAIDVSKLQQHMSPTTEDLFFRDARLGIARFYPEIAVAKHKEFITDVLSRIGTPLRQGLFELRKHNALLTIQMAREFIKKWRKVKSYKATNSQPGNDNWFVTQYHLLLAFPFLDAKEQFDILLLNGPNEDLLQDLINITKPLDETEFEHMLGKACDEENEHKQYLLLVLAKSTSVQLSTVACDNVVKLLQAKSVRVRVQVLGVIAQSGNIKMLKSIVENNWSATDTETEDRYEAWYGSMAILKAAVKGLIAHDNALDLISARMYGRAAVMLNNNAVNNIAHRIDVSINLVIGLDTKLISSDIDIQICQSSSYEPSRVYVSDSEVKDNREKMRRLSEDHDAFVQRQKRNHDAYHKFEDNLTRMKARIILDNISLEEFTAIIEQNESYADRWYDLFMNIAECQLPAVHNLILLLAHALGEKTPDKSRELFYRIKSSKPLLLFTYGRSGVLLDSMSIWAGVRNIVMDELRFSRLDRMRTDHDLANEVLVALLNDQQELLTKYIEIKLNKEEPAENARGIMVAGFSDQSAFNDEIIKKYENSAGLIGSAQQAAKYVYERNIWARYWFEKMCQANDNIDFWRFSLLFLKVVDGRSDIWRSQFTQKENPIMLFESAIDGELKNRFDRCKNNRKKKLFGSDAPELIFLEGADDSD